MRLSVTTDFFKSRGEPQSDLKAIAEAGFTDVHWCHQWNTDFLYSKWEIDQIGQWLQEYNLRLLDLHGSIGQEKSWSSPAEYERQSGLELVRNRIAMTAQLGGRVVIMHAPDAATPQYDYFRRSLDELEPYARERNMRLAIENGNMPAITALLKEYDPAYLGHCYDCGHGNVAGDGLDHLEGIKDRLISIHLHDNDSTGDQHQPLFMGTVDWPRLAKIIATSSYKGPVSMEVVMRNSGIEDIPTFLSHVYKTGCRFTEMVAAS